MKNKQVPQSVEEVKEELEKQSGVTNVSDPEYDGKSYWDITVETRYQPRIPEKLNNVRIGSCTKEINRVLGERRKVEIFIVFEREAP